MARVVSLLLAALVVLLARGASAAPAGLVLRPLAGAAPLELVPQPGAFLGRFLVENRGATSLVVEALELRDGPDDAPRLPAGVEAEFSDGASTVTLAPGESKLVDVRWVLPTPIAARTLWGHVLVRVQGVEGPPAAMGFHAEVAGAAPLGGHLPSSLIVTPLVGALVALALWLFGARRLRGLRWVGVGVGVAQLALACVAYRAFSPSFTRYDGNEGVQMLERARLSPSLGIEYALGLDGPALSLVFLLAILLVTAALASRGRGAHLASFWALLLLLDAALTGALLALDLALLGACLAVTLASVFALIYAQGAARAPAFRFATYALVALALLGCSGAYLSAHAGAAYLADGALAPRAWSLFDLYHADFAGSTAQLFGARAVTVLWSALFVGFAIIAAGFPFHGWLDDALEAVPAPLALMLGGALPALGVLGLARLCFGALGHAAGWAAPTLVVVGALGMLHGALTALVQAELRRFAASAVRFQVGVALVGLGSLTGIGVEAALMAVVVSGLGVALVLGVAGALDRRLARTRLAELGGLGRELPMLALVAAAGLATVLGAPGTGSFLALFMALLGAAARHPWLAIVASLAVVPMAVASARVFHRVFFGELPAALRESPLLEPHGGHPPPLAPGERVALGSLAALVVFLGFWPRPLLSLLDAASLDLASRVVSDPTEIAAAPPPESLAPAAREARRDSPARAKLSLFRAEPSDHLERPLRDGTVRLR
ncbi:MAG: proton-conducting transporter membrane subunit [Sorangiineae bacterium]|nr:proton-conducting transporter membrane subunit [Polyangiaceae bacterium]MEB2322266.1 proton-conducting transporter membrane subunit [Sorangiineae bacterium]